MILIVSHLRRGGILRSNRLCAVADIIRLPRAFKEDDEGLLLAARATCGLYSIKYQRMGKPRATQGTAFFVTQSHLLTAGHNVLDENGICADEISITPPGCQAKLEHTWKNRTLISCKLVGTIHTPINRYRGENDIAILECSNINTGHFLPLADDDDALLEGVDVDIVGYPSKIKNDWVEQHESVEKEYALSEGAINDLTKLLTPLKLIITRGPIERIANGVIAYRISTSPGLSGGCLMYNGKVYGKTHIPFSYLQPGIHLGSTKFNENAAISVAEPRIREFLGRYLVNVSSVPTTEGFFMVECPVKSNNL